MDKNLFQQAAMRKYPEGRMSKDNASFDINLKPGEKKLLLKQGGEVKEFVRE